MRFRLMGWVGALAFLSAALAGAAEVNKPPTAAEAKAFVEEAEPRLMQLCDRSGPGGLGPRDEHHRRHGDDRGPGQREGDRGGCPLREASRPLRRVEGAGRRRPQAPAPEDLADARRAGRSEGGRRGHTDRCRDGGRLRQGQVPAERRQGARGPRRALEDHGEEPRPEGAARRLGRLARDRAAHQEGLRALRRARQQGRPRARASPTRERCGDPSTTCRPTPSRKRSTGSGSS